MTRLLLAALLVTACAKKKEEAPQGEAPVPAMSAEEAQRARDACAEYVKRVCACADKLPAEKSQCDLARALPEAVRLDLEISASPDAKRNDVMGAQKAMRQTVKECIEETAKLPAAGCQ